MFCLFSDNILLLRGLSWAARLAASDIEIGDADLLVPAFQLKKGV